MATLASGVVVDGFVLGELLGSGGMGDVWTARDQRLGRRVALKFLRTRGDARAVARFLEEARLTARVQHPNVVTVFAAGEWRGQPWLAMELLDGLDLRRRLDRPIAVGEAVRVALDVARGVQAGHAAGIVHGDLKPENVVLPSDGRVRVVDFGLARLLADGDGGGARGGTPEYLAPELWRGEPPTPSSDVWALGIVFRELFCGGRPFADGGPAALRAAATAEGPVPPPPNASTLPDELAALLTAALDKRPGSRPSASELVAVLARRLQRGERQGVPDSPFRGLLPYTEGDAAWFFGRDRELAAVVERLRLAPFLPVVGASGAGKSSFVLAGVIPRLREQGALVVVSLRPGPAPLRSLAQALRGAALTTWRGTETDPAQAARSTLDSWSDLPDEPAVPAEPPGPVDPVADLVTELREQPGRLQEHLLGLAGPARALLVVDQLEEVFTQGAPDDEVTAFLVAVLGAGDAASLPLRVVVTVRDDFLGRLAQQVPPALVPREVFVLRPPDAPVLVAALEEALAAADARTDDPRLLADVVASVADSPAALPLAQFAARQLWERRDAGRALLRRTDWEVMGGAQGALSRHADDVLGSLSPPDRAVARELLLRFVTPQGTRRPVDDREVSALTGGGPAGAAVLERLCAGRLLSAARAGDRQVWELAHDSLVSSWPQLARWRAEAGAGARAAQELEAAASLWDGRGRRPSELWGDEALRDVEPRLVGARTTPLAATFLEEARRSRDGRARRRAWTGWGVALLGVALVGASAVGAGAWRRRAEVATAASERARAQEAEALATAAQAAWDRGDRTQARALLRAAAETGDPPAGAALWWQVQRAPVLDELTLTTSAWTFDLSADGARVVVAGDEAEVRFIDLATRAVTAVPLPEVPDAVAFAGPDRVLATWATGAAWIEGGEVRPAPSPAASILWLERVGGRMVGVGLDADEGGRVAVWDDGGGHRNLAGPPLHLTAAASPDGCCVATLGFRGGSILVWDLGSGAAREVVHEVDVRATRLGWSPDGGTLLALGSLSQAFDLRGRGVRSGPGLPTPVVAAEPTADGWLALTDTGALYRWRDGEAPEPYLTLHHAGQALEAVAGLQRAGEVGLVQCGASSWLVALDRSPAAGSGAEGVTALSAGDTSAWAGGFQGGSREWRLGPAGAAPGRALGPGRGRVNAVAVDPGGGFVLRAGNAEVVHFSAIGRRASKVLAAAGDVVGAGFTADGLPWLADYYGKVSVWTSPGEGAMDGLGAADLDAFVYHAASGPGGLAVAQEDGGVRVVALEPGAGLGRELARWEAHEQQANRVAWLDDGRVASAGYDGRVLVHAVGEEDVVVDDLAADETQLAALPGGSLAWVHADGGLRTGRPGEAPRTWFTPAPPTALATSPDGRWLWFGDAHGEVRVLDPATGRITGHRAAPDEPTLEGRTASPAAGGWCVWGVGGAATWVPTPQEDPRWSEPTDGGVGAVGGRCVWLRGGAAWARGPADAAATELEPGVESAAWGDGVAWLVGGGRSALVHAGGRLALERALPARSVAWGEGEVLLGHADGTVTSWTPGADPQAERGLLELPGTAVTALAGRGGWLVLGFEDGGWGVWSRVTGRRVAAGDLRGTAATARVEGTRARVATDLGAAVEVELGPLLDRSCAWRSEVLAAVHSTWRDGRVVPAPAAPDPCR